MNVLIRYFILSIFFLPAVVSLGQIKDNIVWASIKIDKKLSAKSSLYIAPILRLNEDISSYQNTSIDFALKYKYSANWHIQMLSRTWFIPDQAGRQFAWLDVGYKTPIGNLGLASHVRLHLALDIHDRSDPDYLRWKSTISFPNWGKAGFHLAIEPWFRLNDNMQLQRMRYEPGVNVQFRDDIDLNIVYRREDTANLTPYKRFNMYVITLGFKI